MILKITNTTAHEIKNQTRNTYSTFSSKFKKIFTHISVSACFNLIVPLRSQKSELHTTIQLSPEINTIYFNFSIKDTKIAYI